MTITRFTESMYNNEYKLGKIICIYIYIYNIDNIINAQKSFFVLQVKVKYVKKHF